MRREDLVLTKVLNFNHGAALLVDDLEGPRLDILLDGGVIEAATDQTPGGWLGCSSRYSRRSVKGDHELDIEDGISRVHSSLVLGGFTDQALLVGEGDERRGGEATLLVGNDLNVGALIVGNWSQLVFGFRGVRIVHERWLMQHTARVGGAYRRAKVSKRVAEIGRSNLA